METDMSTHTDVIDRYFAIWNETDPARRRRLIAKTWTESANYLDPLMHGDGQAGIDAMIAGVQQRFPGHQFRRTGDIDSHHDRLRFFLGAACQRGSGRGRRHGFCGDCR
jgi:hypothetical protein